MFKKRAKLSCGSLILQCISGFQNKTVMVLYVVLQTEQIMTGYLATWQSIWLVVCVCFKPQSQRPLDLRQSIFCLTLCLQRECFYLYLRSNISLIQIHDGGMKYANTSQSPNSPFLWNQMWSTIQWSWSPMFQSEKKLLMITTLLNPVACLFPKRGPLP